MFSFILWYLTLSLLGLLAFPLAYRLFPALTDRGYGLSRALGLLLWAFIFWLMASFGLIRNDGSGLMFTLAFLGGLSAWALHRLGRQQPSGNGGVAQNLAVVARWMKTNRALVITVEVLFFLAFACMAFVRANNPENIGTEKPMELAFINAILRSPTFPPHDPWLSGYAISYYYFGYVMAAMLAKFTFTSGSVAFNLMLALVFALSALGAFSLLYNLLAAYWKKTAPKQSLLALTALLGPFSLLLLSNAQGFLEFLHARGLGWSGQPGDFNLWTRLGQLVRPNLFAYNFWTWLDIKDLRELPTFAGEPRFWFWWRASRVVQDYDLQGNFVEVIDEFPFFSYLLGDLHPHVLAMPFGLLAAGLALNLFLGGWQGELSLKWFKLPVRAEGFGLLAVVLGGLAFLNTWDFPIYLALAAGALILPRARERGWNWTLLGDLLTFALPLAFASVILYLPFYISFSSQAGGILPNVIFPTRGSHLWIMFGTLFTPLFLFLTHTLRSRAANWKAGFLLAVGFSALLGLFSLVITLFGAQTEVGRTLVNSQGVGALGAVLSEAFGRRLSFSGGLLTLVALIGVALAYLTATPASAEVDSPSARSQPALGDPLPFVWLLILFGGLLVLAPEFVYLRDQFGTRMNTIFKFYYQAWTLWAIAAAFGVITLLREARGLRLALSSLLIGAVLLVGLTYPVLSLPNKTDNFKENDLGARTLDSAAYLNLSAPDDYDAIVHHMQEVPLGVVAEAVGGSYSEYARVATHTGLPDVLNWPGHEGQWRGGYTEQGNRDADLRLLYETTDWEAALSVIEQYDIRYIYIGSLERSTYQVYEDKFELFLLPIYRSGQVSIYQVP